MRIPLFLTIAALVSSCGRAPEGTNPIECMDFADNDGDRLVDCFDPDCVMRDLCDPREGQDVAECLDGIDNDDDGYFDCNDFDCFASPLCFEDDSVLVIPGAGGGGGSGGTPTETPPSGPGPFIHDPMSRVDLTMRLTFDMDEFGDSLCSFSEVCDCFVEFAGSGTYLSGESVRGTFQGDWYVTDTDCSEISGLSNAIWTSDNVAYHTFRWNAAGDQVMEWIAHQFEEDIDAIQTNTAEAGQFWILNMRTPYPGKNAPVSHFESKTDLADLIYITTTFELEATFQ